MKDSTLNDHLSAEQLQALLEGDVPARDLARVEEHLTACARCSAELDAWSVLFEDLGSLPSRAPDEGFAQRVMAEVVLPGRISFAARVRSALGFGFATEPAHSHVATAALQDFLEGDLGRRDAARVERHLELCSGCTKEAATWAGILNRLEELESFGPAHDFADRVMARVDLPVSVSLPERVRSRIATLRGARATRHVSEGLLQDLVDGVLPARAVTRIRSHVDSCGECASEMDAWQGLAGRLEGLATFAPSERFAEEVMTLVQLPKGTPALARRRAASRAIAAAWRLVPQTREAWAAASGVAVTPAVITGVVLYAVFSHPTLTLGSLVSFAWWQVTDLAVAGFAGFSAAAVQSAEAFGVYSLFETLAAAPLMVAAGVLTYSMICALAVRVLYKNLNPNRPMGRYAHVSTS